VLSVNTNMGNLWAQNALQQSRRLSAIAQTRLSTGSKLNSAADDAAGASLSSKITASIIGTKRGIQNAADVIGALDTIDTAYASINDMLIRMKELSLQSANGTYNSTDRSLMDVERAALLTEINSIANSSKFNSRLLLDGTFKDVIAQIGPSATENIEVDIEKIEGVALGKYWELGFDNNDFSETTPVTTSGTTVSVPGWTIELSQVALGPDDSGGAGGISRTIGGFATPTDPTPYPTSPSGQVSRGDDYAPTTQGTYSYGFVDGAMRLFSQGLIVNGGDVTHGPYIISDNSVSLSAGDSVQFNWKAANGGDAYDVYAYLLETTTGATIELLDDTATSTNWTPVDVTVSTAGDYKFVFVSGTFDETFGTVSGASLYIDDVAVTSASGPEVVVEYINVLDVDSANTAVEIIDIAMEQVATHRAYVGALTNRLSSAINYSTTAVTQQEIANGRILDADYAFEMASLAKSKILQNAATNMVYKANKSKDLLLYLIE